MFIRNFRKKEIDKRQASAKLNRVARQTKVGLKMRLIQAAAITSAHYLALGKMPIRAWLAYFSALLIAWTVMHLRPK